MRDRPDTFRVFVYGSREEKIKRMVRLKMSEKEATEMVDTIDQERAAFVRKYFNAEWPCRRLYHMMVNSDMGLEFVTDEIMNAMEYLERKHGHYDAGSIGTHQPSAHDLAQSGADKFSTRSPQFRFSISISHVCNFFCVLQFVFDTR